MNYNHSAAKQKSPKAFIFNNIKVFDSHFHIIDRRFPLVANQGFLPDTFISSDYLDQMHGYQLCGGAIVSGSFQAYDQSYLIDALATLGPSFVGVTQLPMNVSDQEILDLNKAGVRALRFNLKRGGSEDIQHLDQLARRVHEVAAWHVELYIDSRDLDDLYSTLVCLPAVSIDHLGLSKGGFNTLLKLAEQGVRVKATGFGRVDFDVRTALIALSSANPKALMFGTDLPSTRAPRPFEHNDVELIIDALGEDQANRVFCENALDFYRC